MFMRARYQARHKNIKFLISVDDIVVPDICPIFGLKLNLDRTGPNSDASPSLDRVDSSKGYIPGNVQVISWRANNLKGNATLAELIRLGEWAAEQK